MPGGGGGLRGYGTCPKLCDFFREGLPHPPPPSPAKAFPLIWCPPPPPSLFFTLPIFDSDISSRSLEFYWEKRERENYGIGERTKKKTRLKVYVDKTLCRNILDKGCLEEPYYSPVNIGIARPCKISSTCESRTITS